jgi:anti-sigma factor (TIGR02949 family)
MLLGMLTCREALQRLDDYIDRELSQEEMDRVRRHLKICHACTRKFATEESFVREVRAKLDHLSVPSGLMSRISVSLTSGDDPEIADAS